MSDITVNFIHPFDGRILTVTLDDTMSAKQAIHELVAAAFIPPTEDGYQLAIKGGAAITTEQTFAAANITEGETIRVVPVTSAGGSPYRQKRELAKASSIPGLDTTSMKAFSVEDIRNSPEALIMIVHLYDDLHIRHERMAEELEFERFRSRDRFVAALLLFVSQVVLSIAGNLLTSHQAIAIPVFIVGGLQAGLALYLTFRKPVIRRDHSRSPA
jgi:hypothetical protein